MSIVSEFKEFAMRGNVVDLAVGVVIGAAFGKIVASLVDGVVMPLLGLIIGGVNFSTLAIVLKAAELKDGVEVAPAVLLNYGAFIQTIFDFTIIAFAIFLVVKAINSMKRKEQQAPAAPAAPSAEAQLLTEILAELKKNP